MKSAPIERLRQNQKERRNGRLHRTQVQVKSPVISQEPTTFYIGEKEYPYTYKGFFKAITQGLLILSGMLLVIFVLCYTLFL